MSDEQKFDVGQDVFTDGRDHGAVPPLTVDKINMWISPKRVQRAGTIRHGRKVKVLRVRLVGCRFFYFVSTWVLKGWIPESFLSAEKEEPVGELWPAG